jgi:hypothetical protein
MSFLDQAMAQSRAQPTRGQKPLSRLDREVIGWCWLHAQAKRHFLEIFNKPEPTSGELRDARDRLLRVANRFRGVLGAFGKQRPGQQPRRVDRAMAERLGRELRDELGKKRQRHGRGMR